MIQRVSNRMLTCQVILGLIAGLEMGMPSRFVIEHNRLEVRYPAVHSGVSCRRHYQVLRSQRRLGIRVRIKTFEPFSQDYRSLPMVAWIEIGAVVNGVR